MVGACNNLEQCGVAHQSKLIEYWQSVRYRIAFLGGKQSPVVEMIMDGRQYLKKSELLK